MKKSLFDSLINEIDAGLEGKNEGLSIGLGDIKPNITVRKGLHTVIGGLSGTGKTAITDYCFVLAPYEDALRRNIDFKVLYFSYERKTTYKLAKWICVRLMLKYNIVIDTENLLSWNGKKSSMNDEIYAKVIECKEYFERMLEHVVIIDNKENPTGMYKNCLEFIEKQGKILETKITTKEGKEIQVFDKYIPNNERQIIEIVTDHVGLIPNERNFTRKENIDKWSEYSCILRDRFGTANTNIQQFNRGMSDSLRKKQNDIIPRRDDLKDTSDTENDADLFIGILDPLEFNIQNYNDYNALAFKTEEGYSRFRALHVVKNSYGGSGGAFNVAFYGESGVVIKLPKAKEVEEKESRYKQFDNNLFTLNLKQC